MPECSGECARHGVAVEFFRGQVVGFADVVVGMGEDGGRGRGDVLDVDDAHDAGRRYGIGHEAAAYELPQLEIVLHVVRGAQDRHRESGIEQQLFAPETEASG
ncbi:hypothetical protein ABTW96_03835 [Nocardia beijingensis]